MDDPRPPAPTPAFPASRWLVFWGIALGGLAFDLVTKGWIFSSVGQPGSPPVSLIGEILELRTSYNQGALWGIGNRWEYSPWLFAGLSVVAASAIVYWLFFRGGAADRWLTIALALIMAGALGNCYDRITLGHVRDFAHFHIDDIHFDFPIFNFADNMLVIGAAMLFLMALKPDPALEPASRPDPEAAPAADPAQAS